MKFSTVLLTILPTMLTAVPLESGSSPSDPELKKLTDAVEYYCQTGNILHSVIKNSMAKIMQVIREDDKVAIKEKTPDSTIELDPNFKGFIKGFLLYTREHYSQEIKYAYPLVEGLGFKFSPGFGERQQKLKIHFDDLEKLLDNGNNVTKSQFQANFESLQVDLSAHLEEEEKSVTPQLLLDLNVTEKGIHDVENNCEKDIKKADPTMILPFIYFNLDKTERGLFWDKEFPWFVRKPLFFILKNVHRGFWKYAAYPN